jgi:putative endonuclease
MHFTGGSVYIMTNKHHTVLYIGVTSELIVRVLKHKNKTYKGFSSKYNTDKLVYFESYDSIVAAIEREKQLKAGSRQKKLDLINTMNPDWIDLYFGLAG